MTGGESSTRGRMDIRFVTEGKGDTIAVMASEGAVLAARGQALEMRTGGAIARAVAASRFTGAAGQVLEIMSPHGVEAGRLLVIGVGAIDKVDPLVVERWAGAAVRRVLTSGAEHLVLMPDPYPGAPIAEAAARAAAGARLAAYRFDEYRTKLKPDQKPSLSDVQIVIEAPAAAISRHEPLSAVVESVLYARDLVNQPPNVLHPEEYAARIRELESFGLEIEIISEDALEEMGMGSLLGVGYGSVRESQLVALKWNGARNKSAQPLALVGKGVTFDTGGISLKPGAAMDEMKGDMGGSAVVVASLRALAARKARANVVGVVGLVENMPDGAAMRPGDILKSHVGTDNRSVEHGRRRPACSG